MLNFKERRTLMKEKTTSNNQTSEKKDNKKPNNRYHHFKGKPTDETKETPLLLTPKVVKKAKPLKNVKTKNATGDVSVYALGGLGVVGMNMYCVETDTEIIVMDCGILFADDEIHGVEYIIPDFTYLKENEKKIVGVFITHGHEDHIGALPFLLKEVKIPAIYASGIAINLINFKLSEYKDLTYKIIEYNHNSIFNFQSMSVSFFITNHSIPDSHGIAIKTNLGYIVNSGDFKFDFTPLGDRSDFYKMTKLGEEGVLCLLADSTNAKVGNFSLSERKISANMKQMFQSIEGRIIVATFASNVYRVQQILEASVASNRKIAVFGHSMEKTIEAAMRMKYITIPKTSFIPAKDLNKFTGDNITILCTGSQGEPLAALSRIANGTHKQIKLRAGDTVIYSSKPIPGNEEFINRNINLLVKNGANVIKNSPLTDTHTTGHASVSEIKMMLSFIKPKYFFPVHGEYNMLKYHANIAMEMGYRREDCFCLACGDVLLFRKDNPKPKIIKGGVTAGEVYLDSNFSVISNETIKERTQFADEGLVTAIFTINSHKQITAPTIIISKGFMDTLALPVVANNIKEKSTEIFAKVLASYKNINIKGIREKTRDGIIQCISEITERKPYVFVIINIV